MAKPPVNWTNVSGLTPGMKNLGNQFNKRWSKRDGTTDGAKGDSAHQGNVSDHNPDDTPGSKPGWEDSDKTPDIRGIDVDKDLNESGTSMQMVIDHMRSLSGLYTVLRYMIYNNKMYHVDDNFAPTPYTGSNKHTEHAHFSGARSESADQNSTFNFRFEEVGDMGMELDDNIYANGIPSQSWIDRFGDIPSTVRQAMAHSAFNSYDGEARVNEVKKMVDTLADKVDYLTQLVESHISGLIEGTTSK